MQVLEEKNMQMLEEEIKQLIIDTLQLEDMKTSDIGTEAPLFVEGLGLDSIDALELGIALQKKYGFTLSAESEETRHHFSSVRSIAQLVANFKNTQ